MAMTQDAKAYSDRLGYSIGLEGTDPEFNEFFSNFALDEVVHHGDLDEHTRFLAILATLLGCQGLDEFRRVVPAALKAGLTPVEIKEVVYQSVAYLGIGRARPFLQATNEVLEAQGVKLPLEPQATTNRDNRLRVGNQAQIDIFGEHFREAWNNGPEERRHISYWLADNCFGDYYTRGGLDFKQREIITFCYLAAQGGCEPQLTGHAEGNMRVGNDETMLVQVVSQCVPYIGYPRSLNALRCISDAAEKMKNTQ